MKLYFVRTNKTKIKECSNSHNQMNSDL